MEEDLFFEYCCPDGKYTIVVEDDGRVAYAFLYEEDEIVGDVWLYNKCDTPEEPEWNQPDKMPFANAKSFVRCEGKIEPIKNSNEISVQWDFEDTGSLRKVRLFLRNNLYAILFPGAKPGFSRLALKDGPLAKVIPEGSDK